MVSLARTNSAKRCFAARLSLEVFCVLSLAAALWILDGSGHRRSNVKLRHSPFLPFIRLCVFFHGGQIARLGRERGFAIGVVACNGHGERHPPAVWLKKMKSSGRGTICSTATAEQSICIQQNMLQEMERINLRLSMKSSSLPKVKLLLQCFVNMTERDRLLFGGCLPCGRN